MQDFLGLSRHSSALLSLLRIIIGLLLLQHGLMKIVGFPPGPMPQPPLMSLLGLAGILELAGGALLALGLFTRPVAFILSGEMAAAYFIGHAGKSLYPALNMGEAAILFCFACLYIAAAGPGRWALDKR